MRILVLTLATAAGLLGLPAAAQALEQELVAADGLAGDELGTAVAVDGDRAVVGARKAEGGRGAVYVFERSGDAWAQAAKLTASDREAFDGLGFSVAIDGDVIVAGAPGATSAYIFGASGSPERFEIGKLTTLDDAGFFGESVGIDGDTIVVGAAASEVAGSNAGAVFTFARTCPSTCLETATLTASDATFDDRLGASVAIDGDVIVAGAPQADDNDGVVYTFTRTGGDRTQTARLTASDPHFKELGLPVAIDGDVIVAAAAGDDQPPESNLGALYTFTATGPDRTETAKLTASDRAHEDQLGFGVAIDGEIAAGAILDDVGTNEDQGSVYRFARTGGNRTETAKLVAAGGQEDDLFGTSVALDGETLISGAPGTASDRGSATIFFSPVPNPDPDPEPKPDPAPDVDLEPPALKILGKRLTLNRKRVVRVGLRCPGSEASGPCAGELRLRTMKKLRVKASRGAAGAAAKRRKVVLAKAEFEIAAGDTRKVRLRLSKRKANLVRKRRAARRVQATARVSDQAGNSRTAAKRMRIRRR